MVLPITYPAATTTFSGGTDIGSIREYKLRTRQKRPYNLKLPYRYQKDTTWGAAVYLGKTYPQGDIRNQQLSYGPYYRRSFSDRDQSDFATVRAQFANKLASKLASEWRSSASLGETLGEIRQSWGMMISRLEQLTSFARSLRRLDFPRAAKILGVLRTPEYKALTRGNKLRANARGFANNYLEFHFGWSPLVKDIYDAMSILEAPIPLGRFEIKSAFPSFQRIYGTTMDYWYDRSEHLCRYVGRAGVTIEITNPNLFLLNQLGLTNPALIAWNLTPWSFVVDWFVGVSDFLESYSVYHGVTPSDPYHTILQRTFCTSEFGYRAYTWQPWTKSMVGQGFSTVYMERIASLPAVTLRAKTSPLFEGKWRRAVAACSLLIQQGIRR